MVYNGHLKFETSVSLRIPLHGSRNLAYIACKMDYMCPLWRVSYKPYWVYVQGGSRLLAVSLVQDNEFLGDWRDNPLYMPCRDEQ